MVDDDDPPGLARSRGRVDRGLGGGDVVLADRMAALEALSVLSAIVNQVWWNAPEIRCAWTGPAGRRRPGASGSPSSGVLALSHVLAREKTK